MHAIAPANVNRVYINDEAHTMELIVPDDQLARAIGRRGQNVRLAAKLTGWRIDIHSESKHEEMLEAARMEIARISVLDEDQVDHMLRAGFQSAQEIADAEAGEVQSILGGTEDFAFAVVQGADAVVEALIMEEAERRRADSAE